MLFENLNIIKPIQRALTTEGYTEATPIQEKAIPSLLKGMDLLGCAQTGTGKTAAFAIPILQGLSSEQRNLKGSRQIQALILAPTRELAIQIADSFETYGKHLGLRTLVIYGGVSQHPQTKSLNRGIDILVATPGRLLDLINQKFVRLNSIKYFVLDEADMMLDMGMIHDVRRIIKYIPAVRQTMFFSATMPAEIAKLADQILKEPVKVEITPVSSTVDIIEQAVYYVNKSNKVQLLIHLLKSKAIVSALVFSRTKHGADKIVKSLEKAGLQAQAIHGNKSQNARQLALNNFKERKTRILVATDIAARGIDVEELSHVINFDLPEVPETYVHRIGRTGRAGLGGIAISFCAQEEKNLLKEIQKLISKSVPVVEDHPFPLVETLNESKEVFTRKSSAPKTTPANNRRNKEASFAKKSAAKNSKSRYYTKNKRKDN
ncbi:DEAD/DEAH box helicase domain protein [Alkaliphilus metalliredigens QYMF]|uniref:ATP-dependent RNA helicase CshA n=1 Tax=Alkaliphilus metalliredigens (strain QYMF) TaxID=293826 RepID=A6TSD4_ALKMQ|nr:DEAD/DEAH box helicase [Alkaliphilus metalliredigens]ABR49102.1 DEAD/DEAH box helicase domain protein [Alkaliphilus metalliredigens QYMF]